MMQSSPLRVARRAAAALLVLLAGHAGGCTSRCNPSSPCCTGGSSGPRPLQGPDHACATWTEMSCSGPCEQDAYVRQAVQYCSGISEECNGQVERTSWELTEGVCEGLQTCVAELTGGDRCDCALECLQPPQSCGDETASCPFEACGESCCGAPADGCRGTTCASVAPFSAAFSTVTAGSPRSLVGLDDASVAVATCHPVGDCILEGHDAVGTLLWQRSFPGSLPASLVADRAGTSLAAVGYGQCAVIARLGSDGGSAWERTLCTGSCASPWQEDAIRLAIGVDGSVVALALLPPCAVQVDGGDDSRTLDGAALVLLRWSAAGQLYSAVTVASGASAAPGVLESLDDGGVVAVGSNASVVLGAGTPGETSLAGPGLFVARFDAQGALSWARSAVRSAYAPALVGAASAPDGQVVLVARLDTPGSAGPDEPSPIDLPMGRALVALGPDGTLAWGRPWVGPPNWRDASPEGVARAGAFVVVLSAVKEVPGWGTLTWSPPRLATLIAALDDTGALASHALVVEGAASPRIGAHGRRLLVGSEAAMSWVYPYVAGSGVGSGIALATSLGIVVVRELAP